MPRQLYLAALARMGTGRNSPEYHALPAHLRGLADAASAARDAFMALSDATHQARAAREWGAAEALDAAELAQWNAWQAMERQGAELLDAHHAQASARDASDAGSGASAGVRVPAPIEGIGGAA